MNEPSKALREYAERLLRGTGLDCDDAARIAADRDVDAPTRGHTAAAALRDGWAAASRGKTP